MQMHTVVRDVKVLDKFIRPCPTDIGHTKSINIKTA